MIRLLNTVLLAAMCSGAAAMGLDPEFNPHRGFISVDTQGEGVSAACFALAVRPDGRILAGGYQTDKRGSHPLVLQWHADGAPDAAFAENGKVGFGVAERAIVYDLALLPDGRLLAVGSTQDSTSSDVLILRRLADGQADPRFGTRGSVRLGQAGTVEHALAVSPTPGGGILVAGWQQGYSNPDLVLWKLTESGTLDYGFGHGGVYTYDGGGDDFANALKVQADGGILVAGRSRNGRDLDALLLRLTPDGRPDPAFAQAGVARFDDGADETLYALNVMSDGQVLAAGEHIGPDGPQPLLLAYDAHGAATKIDVGPELSGSILAVADLGQRRLLLSGNLGRSGEGDIVAASGVIRDRRWAFDATLGVSTIAGLRNPVVGTAVTRDSRGRVFVAGWNSREDPACFVLRLTP